EPKPSMTDGAAATSNPRTATIISASSCRIVGANDGRAAASAAAELTTTTTAGKTADPGSPSATSSTAQSAAASPPAAAATIGQCGRHSMVPAASAISPAAPDG